MKNKTTHKRAWLSFKVVSITEREESGTKVFDTTLRKYTTDETVTIRGNPWPVGSKLDFKLMKAEDPYKA